MILLFAALMAQHPAWWNDFKQEYRRCGLVYNVDALPAGDGLFFDKDFSGLLLDSSKTRPQKPLHCIARWAKKRGLKVRYRDLD